MPKVKVSKEALTGFERAAAAQGVPVGQWLTAAGLRPTVEHALSRHLGRKARAAVTLDDQEQPPVDASVGRATVPGGE